MFVVMQREASRAQVANLIDHLRGTGLGGTPLQRGGITVIQCLAASTADQSAIASRPGVDRLVEGDRLRLVDRRFQPEDTVVKVGGVSIGSGEFAVVAGPCAVESRQQLLASARVVADAGASILRGDAYKPRTSPYAFQGLGAEGLRYLEEARAETGLPFVAEVVDPRDVEPVAAVADMLRVGTRNMSNHALLKEIGDHRVPVLLKRGQTATIDEWLHAAEYIYERGNRDVVLVERGIRTFETATRDTLDISAVPVLEIETHLPVLVDPSHSSGRRELVPALARAALAAGADGVLIDVHTDPSAAIVDGDQALGPGEFVELMKQLNQIEKALGGA